MWGEFEGDVKKVNVRPRRSQTARPDLERPVRIGARPEMASRLIHLRRVVVLVSKTQSDMNYDAQGLVLHSEQVQAW